MDEKLKERIKLLWILLLIIVIILLLFYGASAVAKNKRSFYVKYLGPESDGISLAEDLGFDTASTVLECDAPEELTCISGLTNIPEDITNGEGCCNGENYIAYSFYIRNTSDHEERVGERIVLDEATKNADAALRIRVYRNSEAVTYALRAADGLPEYGTEPFESGSLVYSASRRMSAGETDKYTIVLWIEGDDPECTNEIGGGSARLHMEYAIEKAEQPKE